MNKESYSVPAGMPARFSFQRNAIDLCTANAAAWGIPADKLLAIMPLQTSFETKYTIAANRSLRSPSATADRDEAWDLLFGPLTELYNRNLLHNDAISAADKASLGIKELGGHNTKTTAAPTTAPIISLVAEEISVLHVVYSDASAPATHSKPNGVAFCEQWAKMDGPAPATQDECPLRYNISRSHDSIVFDPAARGKVLYAFARWVNKNGKTGPFGSLVSAIIP